MKKREFFRLMAAGAIGAAGAALLGGCMAPRIGKNVRDTQAGDPYRCSRCGHLTRSKTDITGDRCPRCRARKFEKITEEEMARYLDGQSGTEKDTK